MPWRPLCIKEKESVENRGKEKIVGIPKAALKGVATVSFGKRRKLSSNERLRRKPGASGGVAIFL